MVSWIRKSKRNTLFWVIKVWKKIAISSEYHISKFPNLFDICKKDLETSVLLLKKCDMNRLILGKF